MKDIESQVECSKLHVTHVLSAIWVFPLTVRNSSFYYSNLKSGNVMISGFRLRYQASVSEVSEANNSCKNTAFVLSAALVMLQGAIFRVCPTPKGALFVRMEMKVF